MKGRKKRWWKRKKFKKKRWTFCARLYISSLCPSALSLISNLTPILPLYPGSNLLTYASKTPFWPPGNTSDQTCQSNAPAGEAGFLHLLMSSAFLSFPRRVELKRSVRVLLTGGCVCVCVCERNVAGLPPASTFPKCRRQRSAASFCFTPPSVPFFWTYSAPLLRGPKHLPLPQVSEDEEDCFVLLCLSVKLWDGHYYYCYYYYDYIDELSCCRCYLKTGPSAIDLKPQQSRAVASRSAPWNRDRPAVRGGGGLGSALLSVSPVGRFLCFCFIGLDSCGVLWLSNCESSVRTLPLFSACRGCGEGCTNFDLFRGKNSPV